MTTEAQTTDRETWQQALSRFEALRILFEADDQWGPLAIATGNESATRDLARTAQEAERATWETEHDKELARQEAELRRHMATIYDPLTAAGLALVRTPAPDLAAVRAKHDACNADAFRLIDYEDEEGELFGIIRADIARLTGIVT